MRRFAEIGIDLERVDDHPAFPAIVARELEALNPTAAARVSIVPAFGVSSRGTASSTERKRYLCGSSVDWGEDRRAELLQHIADRGHPLPTVCWPDCLQGVRQIALRAGDVLIEAGAPSDFVYLPLSDGLQGVPLGGYEAFTIRAWVFVGVTGVVRGSSRNARVFAAQDLELLAIPKGTYLDHWHATYTPAAFAALFR